jgi:hypothetical protein
MSDAEVLVDDLVIGLRVVERCQLGGEFVKPHGKILNGLTVMEREQLILSPHLLKVALGTLSSLMRIILMQSHASFAVGLTASVAIMSAGTALQITLSTVRSTWNSVSPLSTTLHSDRASSLIFMRSDHSL